MNPGAGAAAHRETKTPVVAAARAWQTPRLWIGA